MSAAHQHNDLFVAADSAGRSGDWAGLWALRQGLRRTDLWVGFYGAACAIAGWHVDRGAGWALLDEVIAEGFHQSELLPEQFAESFAREPGWGERLRRMRANVPAPSVEHGDTGTHSFEVATVTPFTTLAGSPLRYVKR